MPKQKPGRSEQTVVTPPEFIAAVEKRFGKLQVDLAASADNAQALMWYGPGSPIAEDSLAVLAWPKEDLAWCNPPYGDIRPWVEKAFQTSCLMLVPASVGANWFRDHVHKKARVYFLNGRLTFVDHTAPYPKDLMLLDFQDEPGYEIWKWR